MSRNLIDRILGRRTVTRGPEPAERDMAWARVVSTARAQKAYFFADERGVSIYLDVPNPHRKDWPSPSTAT